MTTLITLSDPNVIRGYRAGRMWLFCEADLHERRLTDTSLMQRHHELATERHEERDEESTINFAPSCMPGKLSGQFFPLTQMEHERIQEEDRQFLTEYEARKSGASQVQDTDSLPMTVLQEA